MTALTKRPLLIGAALTLVVTTGALVYLSFLKRLDNARRLHQAKDILVASRIYATTHAGRMPKDFGDLTTLANPSGGQRYYEGPNGTHPFLDRAAAELEIVTPGIADTADPRTPFLWERKPDKQGRRVVGYVDASAQMTDRLPPIPPPGPRYLISPPDSLPTGDFMTPLERGRLLH